MKSNGTWCSVKYFFVFLHQGQVESVYIETCFISFLSHSRPTNSLPPSALTGKTARPSSGASRNRPVLMSYRQSWQGQVRVWPSRLPVKSGQAMCAHLPDTAYTAPPTR